MRLALAGLALLSANVLTTVPEARFRPVDGQHYRYVTRQTRIDGSLRRSFIAERTVVFTRLGSGWRAAITLNRTDQTGGNDVGTMFQSAMRALAGKPVSFDLDAEGNVLGVDDLPGVWGHLMDGIDMMVPTRATTRGADTRLITSRMRTLPLERQRTLLVSMLTPLIGASIAGRIPGERAVKVSSVSPLGSPLVLDGEEVLTIEPGGTVSIATNASGSVAPLIAPGLPGSDIAPPAATASATVRVSTLRRIDPATGLIVDSHDENEACTVIDHKSSCISTTTEISITAMVS